MANLDKHVISSVSCFLISLHENTSSNYMLPVIPQLKIGDQKCCRVSQLNCLSTSFDRQAIYIYKKKSKVNSIHMLPIITELKIGDQKCYIVSRLNDLSSSFDRQALY